MPISCCMFIYILYTHLLFVLLPHYIIILHCLTCSFEKHISGNYCLFYCYPMLRIWNDEFLLQTSGDNSYCNSILSPLLPSSIPCQEWQEGENFAFTRIILVYGMLCWQFEIIPHSFYCVQEFFSKKDIWLSNSHYVHSFILLIYYMVFFACLRFKLNNWYKSMTNFQQELCLQFCSVCFFPLVWGHWVVFFLLSALMGEVMGHFRHQGTHVMPHKRRALQWHLVSWFLFLSSLSVISLFFLHTVGFVWKFKFPVLTQTRQFFTVCT